MICEVDESRLDEMVARPGRVMAEFYSPHCGPCKMLSYVLKSVEKERPDVLIAQINFEENQSAVERYEVKGYPTIIVYQDGVELERHNGLLSQKELLKKLS